MFNVLIRQKCKTVVRFAVIFLSLCIFYWILSNPRFFIFSSQVNETEISIKNINPVIRLHVNSASNQTNYSVHNLSDDDHVESISTEADDNLISHFRFGVKTSQFLKNYRNPCWYEECGARKTKTLKCLPYFFVAGKLL